MSLRDIERSLGSPLGGYYRVPAIPRVMGLEGSAF